MRRAARRRAGVEPAKVVILGGGVVGSNAAQMAVGSGAQVVVLDRNIDVLRRLDRLQFGTRIDDRVLHRRRVERTCCAPTSSSAAC
jgi:alanine dehydrogenase